MQFKLRRIFLFSYRSFQLFPQTSSTGGRYRAQRNPLKLPGWGGGIGSIINRIIMRRQNVVLESIGPETFIASAGLECMTELQLGRLAMERGQTESLRHFAHAMIDVYEKATADIARVAARRALPVPNSLDEEHQQFVERMREKSGRDFDLAYTGRMIDSHESAITLFKRGQRIKDPEISALASRTLSVLEARLRRTNSLLESIGPEPQSAGP
jgi:putative membrane protein